jgi:hypothetical protein
MPYTCCYLTAFVLIKVAYVIYDADVETAISIPPRDPSKNRTLVGQ